MDRYGDAPIIYTRVGICADTIREISEGFNAGLTRDKFMETTKIKITSARDKLRDMELYGFIQQTKNGTYVLTDRGKAILSDGPHRSSAIEAAVNRSPLWKQLIATIGKTPDKALFDKTVRSIPSLINIDTDSLDNLWSAYNADIQCITKNPPYSSRQPFVRKLTLHIPSTFTVEPAHTAPTQNTQPDNSSQHALGNGNEGTTAAPLQTHAVEEQAPNPGKVEYRGHVVVVTDDLTAKFAESLVKKMIKDLKRKGVEFDE